jgi:hypothetical protein
VSRTALAVTTANSVTLNTLRSLVGFPVVVETADGHAEAQLLSCVRESAWFVVGDTDVVLPLDQILSVRRACC